MGVLTHNWRELDQHKPIRGRDTVTYDFMAYATSSERRKWFCSSLSRELSAGFVGLDFKWDVGDLCKAKKEDLPTGEKVQWAFAHEMVQGDHVLIFTHHYPFALVRVDGPYNYIRTPVPEIGVWFRHFRRVSDIRYYADHKTKASDWRPVTMTATLTPLRNSDTASQQLVNEWLSSISSNDK